MKYTHLTLKENPMKISKILSSRNILVVRLPNLPSDEIEIKRKNFKHSDLYKLCQISNGLSSLSKLTKVIVFIGPIYLLPYVYACVDNKFVFKNLIPIRLSKTISREEFLANEHIGMIIFTRKSISFNEVRTPYQFCRCCKKTLKDYGGKTHLLHKEGVLISDVWKDFTVDFAEEFPKNIMTRLKAIMPQKNKIVCISIKSKLDYKIFHDIQLTEEIQDRIMPETPYIKRNSGNNVRNVLIKGDVLNSFQKIPDNSVNLALVDPPYNISVKYGKFTDNMEKNEYLYWSKSWIDQISRTLADGGMLALINIPKWSLELFPYLQQKLNFRGWIVWDAWSHPHSKITAAHYPILCFIKGSSHKSFNYESNFSNLKEKMNVDEILYPLNYGYCIRDGCKNKRTNNMKSDRKNLSDLWTDIHRIRHNSFRYSHPTLMPQKLAKRIISIFSKPGDLILDCFNGVGTTTLVAQKMGRNYVGFEMNPLYYQTSLQRHEILADGNDPFDRANGVSTSGNKGYRIIKQKKYNVTKKDLQLEVKRVANTIGHCPTKTELRRLGRYPIEYYYDNFSDWAEITVATRRTGLPRNYMKPKTLRYR